VDDIDNYLELGFFKKSKNLLVTFILVVVSITFFLQALFGLDPFTASFAVFYNLIFAFFVFYNHRWAMIAFLVIYMLDRLIFLLDGLGNPISHFLWSGIALYLTYHSYITATKLKSLSDVSSKKDSPFPK
jgi:hypothetical protein|tara:strand:- start:101 stop:490 length:390 start_codon:yes stop_codon:yes gene_type:complete